MCNGHQNNCGNEQQQEVKCSTDKPRCENVSASVGHSREPKEDASVNTADIPRTEVTILCLTLVCTTTHYQDWMSNVNRRTHITHSNNVDPHKTDLSSLAMYILTEVPEHFRGIVIYFVVFFINIYSYKLAFILYINCFIYEIFSILCTYH